MRRAGRLDVSYDAARLDPAFHEYVDGGDFAVSTTIHAHGRNPGDLLYGSFKHGRLLGAAHTAR